MEILLPFNFVLDACIGGGTVKLRNRDKQKHRDKLSLLRSLDQSQTAQIRLHIQMITKL